VFSDVTKRPELGLFGPDSIAWRVNRELVVPLTNGSRALLLQVAHPKVAAAVVDHSRYRSDPLGRLRDTLDAIFAFTFGDMRRVEDVVGHIHGLHTRVQGATPDGLPYSALDPHLLLWVYATLLDSSLVGYETFVGQLLPADRERYYAEFVRSGDVWGIPRDAFPSSLVELRAWMDSMIASGEVHVSPQGREVGRYILDPPVWWIPPPAALPIRVLTVWLLPAALRSDFGYTWGPRRERVMRAAAACSRVVVPRLPHVMRDLPIARTADRRVRRLAS
jgi:uncharacterized protein (DUF2236 family)